MKRDFLSVGRLVLPVVFTCVVFAIATKMFAFGPPASTPAWAALHDSPASPYHNVIVVAKSGGDFYSVQKALNSILDNSPTNRYLVWVAPGTYTETVTMQPYVDIEGAGEMVTKIVSAGSSYSPTLSGASNAELRYLTVESTNFPHATAIENDNASPSLLHVTISSLPMLPMSNGPRKTSGSLPDIYTSYGIHNTSGSSPIMTDVTVSTTVALSGIGYGMYNDSSLTTMKNVTISISGGNIADTGVYNNNSSSTMKDVTITASGGTANYGVYNNNSSSTMKDVTITASETGVGNYNSSSYGVTIDDSTIIAPYRTIASNQSTRVGASRLEGGTVEGTVTCAGVYDENYSFFPNTCP